jgi:hypothetical protein
MGNQPDPKSVGEKVLRRSVVEKELATLRPQLKQLGEQLERLGRTLIASPQYVSVDRQKLDGYEAGRQEVQLSLLADVKDEADKYRKLLDEKAKLEAEIHAFGLTP